jgi:hypothetical protein
VNAIRDNEKAIAVLQTLWLSLKIKSVTFAQAAINFAEITCKQSKQ